MLAICIFCLSELLLYGCVRNEWINFKTESMTSAENHFMLKPSHWEELTEYHPMIFLYINI